MNPRKQLWALLHLGLPLLGFILTSSGACLLSQEHPLAVVPACAMVVLGFLLMIGGAFWSVCRSMRSKMYQRRAPPQQMHIFTVDRPSSFPPSYEESQRSQSSCPAPPLPQSLPQQSPPPEVTLHMDHAALAPPLYSQDSSMPPDCSLCWEPPPRYS